MGFGQFKKLLADTIIAYLTPIQERYNTIMADKAQLHAVLREGRKRADAIASAVLDRAVTAMGFVPPSMEDAHE
jgi:tryptophanyl-tRNA synthetase